MRVLCRPFFSDGVRAANRCDEAELWGDARSWRKKADKASRPEEEEDVGDEERTASFFADGPMLQNMQASPSR